MSRASPGGSPAKNTHCCHGKDASTQTPGLVRSPVAAAPRTQSLPAWGEAASDPGGRKPGAGPSLGCNPRCLGQLQQQGSVVESRQPG